MPLDQTDSDSHWTYIFGVGGGMKFVMWENEKDGKSSTLQNLAVDIQMNYERSGVSRFVVVQNLSRPGLVGPVLYDTTPSKFNFLQLRFGFSMNLQ